MPVHHATCLREHCQHWPKGLHTCWSDQGNRAQGWTCSSTHFWNWLSAEGCTLCVFAYACAAGAAPLSFFIKPGTSYVISKINIFPGCVAVGTPTPVVTWLRDNNEQALRYTSPAPTVVLNTLTFKQATTVAEARNISGWYSCRATNRYGSIYADFSVRAYGE